MPQILFRNGASVDLSRERSTNSQKFPRSLLRSGYRRDGREFLGVAIVLFMRRWYGDANYRIRGPRSLAGSDRVCCRPLGVLEGKCRPRQRFNESQRIAIAARALPFFEAATPPHYQTAAIPVSG